VQKFVMLTGHVYSTAAIIASDDVMEDLSPAERLVVRQAATEAGRMTRTESAARATAGLIALRAQGISIIETIDRPSFVTALAPAIPAIAAKYGVAQLELIRNVLV